MLEFEFGWPPAELCQKRNPSSIINQPKRQQGLSRPAELSLTF
jgi:hypothetical protein